ncbi:MAG: TrmH family RNA methyltransferase [Sediminispirochaetaceae bacterium]
MITVNKLRTLPPKTRLRKIITMIEGWERAYRYRRSSDPVYQRDVFRLLAEEPSDAVRPLLDVIEQILGLLSEGPFPDDPGTDAKRKHSRPANSADTDTVLRLFQHVRYGLMDALGVAPADWDYYDPEAGELTRPRTALLPIALYLDDIRSPYNVGSIFRTAEAFGIEKIYLSRYTASPAHKRAVRTSMGCTEILPWQIVDLEEAARERPVFALELGGAPIEQYSFPYRGIAVLGSEELGISPEARRIASGSGGIVSVPLRGAKGSLNVAVAAGILLHAWSLSLGSQPEAHH